MTQDEEWLLEEKYNGQKTEGFLADCQRLNNGEPLAYIIGSIPFLHTTIYLDSHPLIPRTETEYWVEKILPRIKEKETSKVLDLCAGSGCIGVAVLTDAKQAYVDFAEIDTDHHPTILKNIQENNIETTRTHIYGGDLFSEIPAKQYDFILTNPPYIDPHLDRTQESVKNFEPHRALYSEQEGLGHIVRIIRDSITYLTSDGTLVIEHEPEQMEAITSLGTQNGFSVVTHPDQYGVSRYTILTRIAV
jgi:release factor glutamine methyltransferase